MSPDPQVPIDRFEHLPVDAIVASKTNPRTHFDEAYLDALAGSIRDKGLLQPIIVRLAAVRGHKPAQYEIVAGECRWRAMKRAGLSTIATICRPYTDEQVLELQLIENIHRHDLTPLEQAAGYRRLIESDPTKHSAESIARRIGMSPAYVWDRLKLNDLVPDAKQLLARERIGVAHAIVIARLKPEDQLSVIAGNAAKYGNDRGGLWDREKDLLEDEDDDTRDKWAGLKPVTVRELEGWIDTHIRFDADHAAQAQPLTFEELPATIKAAQQQPGRGKKVIPITYDHYIQPEARDSEERTYGPRSWKRADGTKGTSDDDRTGKPVDSPTCEHSVLGLVVVGPHRGESFAVCIARDKCLVHWKADVKAKQARERAAASGRSTATTQRLEAKAQARRARQVAEDERREKRWAHFEKALRQAVEAKVAQLGAQLPKALYARTLRAHRLPEQTTPAGLARALCVEAVRHAFQHAWYGDEKRLVEWATLLGVDVAACEPTTPDAGKKPAKKGKGGR